MKAKLVVPERLDEITLKQYIDFLDVNHDRNELEVLREIISILCTGDMRVVDSMSLGQLKEVSDILNKLISETKTPYTPIVTIDGQQFGFIPKLNEITVGEYSDLELYFDDKYYKNLHRIMAILYRPVASIHKDLYSIENYQGSDKYADYFLTHFPVSVVNGALLFFFNLGNELSKITSGYTSQKTKKKAQTSSPN